MPREEPPAPRVEFALGEQVSDGLFKSSYARSFVSCGGSKSLAPGTSGNGEHEYPANGGYFSLDQRNLTDLPATQLPDFDIQMSDEEHQRILKAMEDLRKDNQRLRDENTRLKMEKNARSNNNIEVIDCACLQNQISTLEWQLQQSMCDRRMCRSVLEQVHQFLDRVRKSMLAQAARQASNKCCPNCGHVAKDVSAGSSSTSNGLVPRSRSVHAIPDGGERCGSSPTPSMTASSSSVSCVEANSASSSHSSVSSSSSSSHHHHHHFPRAKSVAQIPSPCGSSSSSSTSSASNDSGHGSPHWWPFNKKDKSTGPGSATSQTSCGQTSSQSKPRKSVRSDVCKSAQDVNKTQDSDSFRTYRKPKPAEINPDEVPPEKLAEEAFRLGRTVQSVLSMRDPELAHIGSLRDTSGSLDFKLGPREQQQQQLNGNSPSAELCSLPPNFASSTALSSGLDRSASEDSGSTLVPEPTVAPRASSTIKSCSSRHSMDVSGLGFGSSNVRCEDEADRVLRTGSLRAPALPISRELVPQVNGHHQPVASVPVAPATSTPQSRRAKALERKELNLKSFKDWALNGVTSSPSTSVNSRIQAAASVCSSADTESGFSSLSSFQEVGLPGAVASSTTVRPGCHTEVGLPEVPVDKVRHRRWSSTPVECQNVFKRHSGNFAPPSRAAGESLSIWV